MNGQVFVYVISGFAFNFHCRHLNFRYITPISSYALIDSQVTIDYRFTINGAFDMIRKNTQTFTACFAFFNYLNFSKQIMYFKHKIDAIDCSVDTMCHYKKIWGITRNDIELFKFGQNTKKSFL